MADQLYDYGLDEWRDWATSTYVWLALKASYTPSRTHRFISDITAQEVTVGGYHRSTVSSPTRTVDTTQHRVTYDCADPDFGTPGPGQTVSYVLLAKQGGNDSTSLLMGLYDIQDFVTDGGLFAPVVAVAGVHYIDQG
jgi:hypothetical protein